MTDDNTTQNGDFDAKDYGKFNIQAVEEMDLLRLPSNRAGGPSKRLPTVIVTHGRVNDPMQIAVVDDAGQQIHQAGYSRNLT